MGGSMVRFFLLILIAVSVWAQESDMQLKRPIAQRIVDVKGDVLELLAAYAGVRLDAFNQRADRLQIRGGQSLTARASSTLADDGYGPYDAARANDGTALTLWAEGGAGPGIGQWLATVKDHSGDTFLAYPGHPRLWRENNRVKSARVLVFAVFRDPSGNIAAVHNKALDLQIGFQDKNDWQYFAISERLPAADAYVTLMVIQEVWPGSRWSDTCVAEMGMTVSQ